MYTLSPPPARRLEENSKSCTHSPPARKLEETVEKKEVSKVVLGTDNLGADLVSLRTNGIPFDANFKVSESGPLVDGHRIILAARSSVFKQMLFGEMCTPPGVPIDLLSLQTDPQTFSSFIDYLYGGQISLSSIEHSLDLYSLSDYFAVSELGEAIKKYIRSCLTSPHLVTSFLTHQHSLLPSLLPLSLEVAQNWMGSLIPFAGDLTENNMCVFLQGFDQNPIQTINLLLSWAETHPPSPLVQDAALKRVDLTRLVTGFHGSLLKDLRLLGWWSDTQILNALSPHLSVISTFYCHPSLFYKKQKGVLEIRHTTSKESPKYKLAQFSVNPGFGGCVRWDIRISQEPLWDGIGRRSIIFGVGPKISDLVGYEHHNFYFIYLTRKCTFIQYEDGVDKSLRYTASGFPVSFSLTLDVPRRLFKAVCNKNTFRFPLGPGCVEFLPTIGIGSTASLEIHSPWIDSIPTPQTKKSEELRG